MSLEYTLSKVDNNDISVLKVAGELDISERKKFLNGLNELIETGSAKVVIDLSRINSMSSLFIGSLVDFGGKVNASGKTIAVMVKPAVAKVCSMIGLEKVVQLIEV
ncbi:MAG: STAS domain-containing protein [Planctomycetota bacterium]